MDHSEQELKQLLIEALNLEDITPGKSTAKRRSSARLRTGLDRRVGAGGSPYAANTN